LGNVFNSKGVAYYSQGEGFMDYYIYIYLQDTLGRGVYKY
jgi:hypothetical protein